MYKANSQLTEKKSQGTTVESDPGTIPPQLTTEAEKEHGKFGQC